VAEEVTHPIVVALKKKHNILNNNPSPVIILETY